MFDETSYPNQHVFPRRQYGAPISRKRLYLIMVRKDVMIDAAKEDFSAFIKKKLDGMKVMTKHGWFLT